MKPYYIAHGSVRGSCPHKHRTIGSAQACVDRDSNDCGSLGGGAYSDRSVWAVEDGRRRDLTEAERDELYQITDQR